MRKGAFTTSCHLFNRLTVAFPSFGASFRDGTGTSNNICESIHIKLVSRLMRVTFRCLDGALKQRYWTPPPSEGDTTHAVGWARQASRESCGTHSSKTTTNPEDEEEVGPITVPKSHFKARQFRFGGSQPL